MKKYWNYHELIRSFRLLFYRLRPIENRFERIYRKQYWQNPESVSGPGSTLQATATLREHLPTLLRDLEIKSLLDIPCGDFHWMKEVELPVDFYIGADIVEPLIRENIKKYQRMDRLFFKLNILSDDLPQVDLILCRDLLVHFSNKDIIRAIKNIKSSSSTYLLTTHYPSTLDNIDIVTGQWRPLNLLRPPFCFPVPILVLNENDPNNSDKSLALFRIDDIPTNFRYDCE